MGMRMDETGKRGAGIQDAWTVILGILLGFSLTIALRTFFGHLFSEKDLAELIEFPWAYETIVRWAQFFTFLVLIGRFFGGAYRYHQELAKLDNETTKRGNVWGTVLNLVGMLILFLSFSAAGMTVWSLDIFYFVILVIHIVDTIWFLCAQLFLRRMWNLPKQSTQYQPVAHFLTYSITTMMLTVLVYLIFNEYVSTTGTLWFQWYCIIVLWLTSFIDFYQLKDFYFYPERWDRRFKPTTR